MFAFLSQRQSATPSVGRSVGEWTHARVTICVGSRFSIRVACKKVWFALLSSLCCRFLGLWFRHDQRPSPPSFLLSGRRFESGAHEVCGRVVADEIADRDLLQGCERHTPGALGFREGFASSLHSKTLEKERRRTDESDGGFYWCCIDWYGRWCRYV